MLNDKVQDKINNNIDFSIENKLRIFDNIDNIVILLDKYHNIKYINQQKQIDSIQQEISSIDLYSSPIFLHLFQHVLEFESLNITLDDIEYILLIQIEKNNFTKRILEQLHDLKEPINGLIGITELLKLNSTKHKMCPLYISMLVDCTNTLSDIIRKKNNYNSYNTSNFKISKEENEPIAIIINDYNQETSRFILTRMFENIGYKYKIFHNVKDALYTINILQSKNQKFIIFIDISDNLYDSQLNTLDIIQELRKEHIDSAIIGLSSCNNLPLEYECDVNKILIKPILQDTLQNVLIEYS